MSGDTLTFARMVASDGDEWNTCNCEDGSNYQCQSSTADGDACCGRSKPALCATKQIPRRSCSGTSVRVNLRPGHLHCSIPARQLGARAPLSRRSR
jgi:hypothetical protein